MNNSLTDVPGIKVGHWTDLEGGTGCTVVLCPEGAVAGVDVRGTAPGTRETDLLNPVCMVDQVHAILIGGGSAFGLAAADGVMRWLEEHGYGFDVGVARVPIVPAAILYDLPLGDAKSRPTAESGYAACEAASDGPIMEGTVGAGTGAAAGKIMGLRRATKSGLGAASMAMSGGVVVAALVAANPFGQIVDPQSGATIAGPRKPTGGFADTVDFAASMMGRAALNLAGTNTTLAVVATNVKLDKAGATKVAQMAQDALARTTRPAHTHFDGDTVFALSYGEKQADLSLIGALAADVLASAIVRAVRAADSLHGIPCAAEVRGA